ncbi:MAG TPA: hypothetical protein VI548_03135 [Chitinophagaceae bacterium]|nr:hypothetical protein [Chitinophagaceae bacterium]
MKLSPLLAQFLYLNKELNLNGIGRFRMESIPEQTDNAERSLKSEPAGSIHFQYDSSVKEDEKLVEYISEQTGKMKSLASSDLDSYLELARQFLNIGKPFLIEGVGTLSKNKSEKLDFTPGHFINERMKENSHEETDQVATTEESFTDYEEMLSPQKTHVPVSRKIVLFLAIIAGIGLAIWGGYFIYKKTNTTETQKEKEPATLLVADSSNYPEPDSSIIERNSSASTGSYYKFVIEKADSSRAFTRFRDLKNYGLDIMIETNDSVTYKLFFKLAASPADTARIRDSLNVWYSTRSKTSIEN